MNAKITRSALALALAACLLLSLPCAAAAGAFQDSGRHWSGQVVEKANALDLMKGYPGNFFYPEDPVSRLEAIAIVIRAMGLENQAKNLDYKNSGIRLPQGMFWGQGHLVVAAQRGLLDRNSLSGLLFKDPIPRQEVATLVALALQSKLQVKGDTQKLNFADTDQINSVYRQYVADVTQNGIMEGLENNRFGPDEVMKRGQMAALMVKVVQDSWFDYGAASTISGTLTAVDGSTGMITISKSDGTPMPRLTDLATAYFRGTSPAILADFIVGEAVTAICGGDGKVRYLETVSGASTPPAGSGVSGAEQQVTGKVTDRFLTGTSALRLSSNLQVYTYPLAPTVTVSDGTNIRDLSYLADGSYVTAKIKDNIIQSVWVLPSEEVEGVVIAVQAGQFTMTTASGVNRVFSVRASEVKIARGGTLLPFSDLKSGDNVKVVSVSGEAKEISLSGESSKIEGEVRTVDSYYRMVTMLYNGLRREFEVELNASISKGYENVRIDELKQGDRVRFKVGGNGKIVEIAAVGEGVRSVSGKVTDIYTGSSPRIYVEEKRYYLGAHVDITRDGDTIDLDEIMIGSGVNLELDEDDLVCVIEVTDDEDVIVEGTVTDVDEDSNRLTIAQSNDREFTLRVSSSCNFIDQTGSSSPARELDDLRNGWQVKLYLDGGRVRTVKVIDR